MSWRDELLPASFRGVPFYVDAAEGESGRRTVTHEFAGRDRPFVEDLGRATRRVKIEGYVVGPDYMADRDELRAAFETPGSGRLVHPWWGELEATLEDAVKWKETTAEGGMARFSAAFVEAGNALAPVARRSTRDDVATAADVVIAAATEQFAAEWSVVGAAASYVADAVAMVQAAVSLVRRIKGKIDAALSIVDEVAQAIDDVAAAIATVILLPRTLAEKLVGLYATVLGAITRLVGAVESYAPSADPIFQGATSTTPPPTSLDATLDEPAADRQVAVLVVVVGDAAGFGVNLSPTVGATTTVQRAQRDRSAVALQALVRTTAAVEACRTAASLDYSSYDQASAVRSTLVEVIDELAATAPDPVYDALVDLRSSVAVHLAATAEVLPPELEYVPAATLPALVIAHQFYGDAKREAEIVARNRIAHPGFVAGGEALRLVGHG